MTEDQNIELQNAIDDQAHEAIYQEQAQETKEQTE